MTKLTLVQAQNLSLEAIDAMSVEEMQNAIEILSISNVKKSRLKVDQIKGILERRRKEAKKSGKVEELNMIKQVENSAKKVISRSRRTKPTEQEIESNDEIKLHQILLDQINDAKTIRELKQFMQENDIDITVKTGAKLTDLKAQVKEFLAIEYLEQEEQEEYESELIAEVNALKSMLAAKKFAKENGIPVEKLTGMKLPQAKVYLLDLLATALDELEEETEQQEVEQEKQEKPVSKAKTDDTDLKKEVAKLRAEMRALKEELFPERIETTNEGTYFERLDVKSIKEVQDLLVQRPYQVYCQIHEGLDNVATSFVVTFINENLFLVVDKSRHIDTSIPLDTKTYKNNTVMLDGRACPVQFYLLEKEEE